MESIEFKQGVEHAQTGHSKSYNPYRHKGTPKQFNDWIAGWGSVS